MTSSHQTEAYAPALVTIQLSSTYETVDCQCPAPAGSRGTLRMTASVIRKVKKRERKRLDLPWFTQKANKAPVFQGVILKEEQREKRREKEKNNNTGRPSFGE